MNSRSHQQNSAYMERAIEKATKLIELLTKENEDLKNELQKNEEDAILTKKLKIAVETINEQLQLKNQQLAKVKGQLSQLENKLEDKICRNKQLHEKLAEINHKQQQNTKKLEKERKKNLALENQNQYLLKNLTSFENKENQFHNYCSLAESEFKRQMILLQRTKTAFSRKCDDLSFQNTKLKEEIVRFRLHCAQLQKKIGQISPQENRLQELQLEIKKTNDALAYLIQSTLKVKAETGLYLKVEQIKNYLTYRLQHIEKLVQPISTIFGQGNQGKGIKNLQEMSTLATRLAAYLGDLIK